MKSGRGKLQTTAGVSGGNSVETRNSGFCIFYKQVEDTLKEAVAGANNRYKQGSKQLEIVGSSKREISVGRRIA